MKYLNAVENQSLAKELANQIENLYDEVFEEGNYRFIEKDVHRLNEIGKLETIIRRGRGFFGDDVLFLERESLLMDKAIGLNNREGELNECDNKLVALWQSATQQERVVSFIVHLHISVVCGLYHSDQDLILMFKHACILIGFTNSPDPNEVQRQNSYNGAMERHRLDPKKKEIEFVKECWGQWQLKPEKYRTKAAFARDMLNKCEHLISQKTIEDWCREWGAENKIGTMPAE